MVDLSFSKIGRVTGARVFVYLLEHTRVSGFHDKSDKNFHIFHWMIRKFSQSLRVILLMVLYVGSLMIQILC